MWKHKPMLKIEVLLAVNLNPRHEHPVGWHEKVMKLHTHEIYFLCANWRAYDHHKHANTVGLLTNPEAIAAGRYDSVR
jgi:hypothetical protein